MRLTRYTDYALRVLIYLGLKDGEKVTIREIADRYDISENHLMKVVHKLGQEDFIRTARGRGGGLTLGRAPSSINLGQVVRACEDDLSIVECFNKATNTCPIAPACGLTGILNAALAAFLDVIDQYTLADLLAPAPDLERALSLPAAP